MLKAGIRRQTIANKFVPVVGGFALQEQGRAVNLSTAWIVLSSGPSRHSLQVGDEPETPTRRWSADR
jgi:hypothetical protein